MANRAGMTRGMKLGAILEGVGSDTASWRDPEVRLDASIDVNWYIEHARLAEAAKFHFLFLVDSPFVTPDLGPHFLNRLEPLTLLSALAVSTSRIGLVATASTSFCEPYNLARQFASLDHISGGRAGWNVVTTAVEHAAANFGLTRHPGHAERYARANEFIGIAKGLWDSYEDGAFPRDRSTGQFIDTSKQHRLDHKGEHFSVAGPLAITRSPQGQTVIFLAGDSPAGRAVAGRHAEAVLTSAIHFEQAREDYRDIKAQVAAAGRDPGQVLVLPGLVPLIAETDEEAEAVRGPPDFQRLIAGLARIFDFHDFGRYDLDGPFPDLSHLTVNAFKGQAERIIRATRAEPLTVREVALRFDLWRSNFIGSPETIADEMQRWFEGGACDGFILRVVRPAPFRMFRERVIPILRERRLFHADYDAATLRGNLGLPVPRHRHAPVA